ncbi:MAG: CoB--CoM heterodisulfide reductase iron-sulfur subunit A family protein, partial [Chloroflexi bacterium]
MATKERIGVYICHCGSNIAGTVDVEEVARWAGEVLADEGVVVSRDYQFMCSSLGQELIESDIREMGLTRVIVGACSPHLHEATFRRACERAGLNPFLCEMVSLREQISWVHTDKRVATEKAKSLIAGGVTRILAKSVDELAKTDIADYALEALRHSRVKYI